MRSRSLIIFARACAIAIILIFFFASLSKGRGQNHPFIRKEGKIINYKLSKEEVPQLNTGRLIMALHESRLVSFFIYNPELSKKEGTVSLCRLKRMRDQLEMHTLLRCTQLATCANIEHAIVY